MRDDILHGVFAAYCRLVGFLFNLGAPAWVVNAPGWLVPGCLLRAGARVVQQRQKAQSVAGGVL